MYNKLRLIYSFLLILGCASCQSSDKNIALKTSSNNSKSILPSPDKSTDKKPPLITNTHIKKIANETKIHLVSEIEHEPLGNQEKQKSIDTEISNFSEKLQIEIEPQIAEEVVPLSEPNRAEEALTSNDEKSPLKTQVIIPHVPSPNITSPPKYDHPLKNSNSIIFMLGEDSEGFYLYGEGAIAEGAYEKFMKYVAYYNSQGKNLNRLMLHSPGGVLHEGLKIGQYLRSHAWTTDSDKFMKCYSTCGFIYAAGMEKRFQVGAEVGFHRPYLPHQMHTERSIALVYEQYLPYWQYVEGDQTLYDSFMHDFDRDEMLILTEKNISQHMDVEFY